MLPEVLIPVPIPSNQKMACEESVYLATVLLFLEASYRYYRFRFNEDFVSDNTHFTNDFFILKGKAFFFFFAGSVFFSYFYLRYWQNWKVWSTPFVRSALPYLYMFDPLAAILIGYGQYYNHQVSFLLGLIILTNFFLIHVIQRIFAKKKPIGMVSRCSSLFSNSWLLSCLERRTHCDFQSSHSSHGQFLLY